MQARRRQGAGQAELPRIAAEVDKVPPRLAVPAHRGHGTLSAGVGAALLWIPMPAAFGSIREIPIASLASPVRALFQGEALRDMREVARGQVPAAGPAKVAHFQAASLGRAAQAAERGRVPAEGRIFGGLHRVGAAKVTARKEDVGRAQQQGCAADAPPAQARVQWPWKPG